MNPSEIEFCKQKYREIFDAAYCGGTLAATRTNRRGEEIPPSASKYEEIEKAAQKKAIEQTVVLTMQEYPDIEAEDLWRTLNSIHVHHKSGIEDLDLIGNVISANQSWIKSSGHAFEELIKEEGSRTLAEDNIQIVLQKDLSRMLKGGLIANQPQDIDWLKKRIKASTFDLYALVEHDGSLFCFGCIQSKTSVRDRVTRDREPSIKAMQNFFWSVAVVFDGTYLKQEKFIDMVNGGGSDFAENGWHGLYVFSDKYAKDRIYSTDLEFKNFKEHAIKAAQMWLTQRQWLNTSWRADSK